MKYNKKVYLPENMTEEIEILSLRRALLKEIKNYCEKHKCKMSMRALSEDEMRHQEQECI